MRSRACVPRPGPLRAAGGEGKQGPAAHRIALGEDSELLVGHRKQLLQGPGLRCAQQEKAGRLERIVKARNDVFSYTSQVNQDVAATDQVRSEEHTSELQSLR